MNSVNLIGCIGVEPQIKVANDNRKYCSFTVLAKSSDSKKNRTSESIPVAVWDSLAISFANTVSKGDKISVEGEIETVIHKNRNGDTAFYLSVRAERIEYLYIAHYDKYKQESIDINKVR